MGTESIKTGPEAGEGLPESESEETSPDFSAEKLANGVLATIRPVEEGMMVTMHSAGKQVEKLGGDPEELKPANEKFTSGIESAGEEFLNEVLKTGPDELRQIVNEHAAYLATLPPKERSPKALSQYYAIDPETAEAYFKLAQTFAPQTGGKPKEGHQGETGTSWAIPEHLAPKGAEIKEEYISPAETSRLVTMAEREKAVLEQPAEVVRTEEIAETETAQPKAEIPKSVLSQLSPDNRNLIQRLPENVWHFLRDKILKPPAFVAQLIGSRISHKAMKDAGEVHRRYGFVGSRIGILFNSTLIDREKTGWIRYGTTAEGLTKKIEASDFQVRALKEEIGDLNAEEKALKEGGGLSLTEQTRFANAREKIERKLSAIEHRREVLGHRLAEVQSRIGRYEARRAGAVESLIKRVESRLNPILERSEQLKADRQKLEAEIAEFSKLVEVKKAKLEELQAKMAKSRALKSALKERKRDLTATIKKAGKLIAERQSQMRETDRQLGLLQERANPYIEMRDQFNAVIEKKAVPAESEQAPV